MTDGETGGAEKRMKADAARRSQWPKTRRKGTNFHCNFLKKYAILGIITDAVLRHSAQKNNLRQTEGYII